MANGMYVCTSVKCVQKEKNKIKKKIKENSNVYKTKLSTNRNNKMKGINVSRNGFEANMRQFQKTRCHFCADYCFPFSPLTMTSYHH